MRVFDGVSAWRDRMRLWLQILIKATYGSQRRFCQVIGKADDWLSRVVRGWKDPTDEEMHLIAEKLGVGPDGVERLFAKKAPGFDTDLKFPAE